MLIIMAFFPGSGGLRLVSTFSLEKNIHLTGSFIPVSDSLIVFTANGGLYAIHPNAWIKHPNPTDVIVSYIYRPNLDNALMSTYNYDLAKGFIVWEFEDKKSLIKDTIASIDSCFCFIENSEEMILVHGYMNNKYKMWELTSEGFSEIFSLPYAPTDIQVINKSSILISFYTRILWINRETGPSIFYDSKAGNILGFFLTPADHLYVATEDGIMQVTNGIPELEINNVKGRMSYSNGNIYVVDQENSTISILTED